MRLKSADLVLLKVIHNKLVYHHENELAKRLQVLLGELELKQDKEREANRRRAEANRKAGYAWKSSNHPKRSKYTAR